MDSIIDWYSSLTANDLLFGGLLIIGGAWMLFAATKRQSFYVYSLVIWAAAAKCFYLAINPGGNIQWIYFGGCIVAYLIGRELWHRAENYYEIEIEELDKQRQLQVAENNLYEARAKTHYLPAQISKEVVRDDVRLDSEVLSAHRDQEAIQIGREEQQLRRGLLEESKYSVI